MEYWTTTEPEQTWNVAVICVFLYFQGRFCIAEGLYVSGKSPEAIQCLCRDVLQCATYYQRLSEFARPRQPNSLEEFGLVMEAFRSGLGRFLQHYRAFVLAVPKSSLTLLQLNTSLRKVMIQIRYVSVTCYHYCLLSAYSLLWLCTDDTFPKASELNY